MTSARNAIVPVPVNATVLVNTLALAAGDRHTCALRADGRVFCWGRNNLGQLGNASAGSSSDTPVFAGGSLAGVTAIAAGGSHTCALSSERAVCWGNNSFGQLGNGSAGSGEFSDLPVLVGAAVIVIDATAISAGGAHTCDLSANGAVFCWGNNEFGQIGSGSTGSPRTSPFAVPSFTLNIDPLVSFEAEGEEPSSRSSPSARRGIGFR